MNWMLIIHLPISKYLLRGNHVQGPVNGTETDIILFLVELMVLSSLMFLKLA